ncbi:hypothetical protein BW687_001915 [Pseudomonas graminis]|uniref:hypothetical protein n=1 Tax=Pseudomonas graminis TaxID=158627 RepID=UPI00234A0F7B|nr:hypothetical protein [Pseudomonas graminis]MDC6378929.1 hypothetical protein [Pseudomonas graminis]
MTKDPECVPYNIASDYEDQTVKLSVKIDGLVFAAISLEKSCRKIVDVASVEVSTRQKKVNAKSRTMLYEELVTTNEELIILKTQVRETIAAVTKSNNVSLSNAIRFSFRHFNTHDEVDGRSIACSCDVLAKCVSVLTELDRDLLSTQNLIEKIMKDSPFQEDSSSNMLEGSHKMRNNRTNH